MKKIPFVILHGWNLNSKKFTSLSNSLSKMGYRVYCPDLPGFGKSNKPEKSFKLGDYLFFVVNFLKQNNINKANFICHSFGGRIGIKLAVINPEKINKLILTGVPGIPPVPREKVIFFLLLAKLGKLIFSLPFLSVFKNISQKVLYKLAGASDFYHTDQHLRETFQNVVSEKLTFLLAKITVPTFLIWGRQDSLVPISIAKKMKRLIPKSCLIIVNGVGHAFVYENTDIFIKYLRPVINK
ncbi:hypothetical protein A3I51_00345 [Candidatus Gottesmanbacteria bacterium RIFCSPLOWO2_02_FULL_38_8]|uniref:AB hydrolase-1 domain-containing protein n=1 Tax=Candidatus Gottesmanbacteria bacterium RIFCSPLOWO2_02_FULL_38_8 TaxID=1798397 RepID=A0A1F6B290_9BACT|nr:MAG: hypothetical protein A3I51_00345 [Candidatus Gottesmanbacteria bacterium RIFCSPLOWO2_02_FULL_38_8]